MFPAASFLVSQCDGARARDVGSWAAAPRVADASAARTGRVFYHSIRPSQQNRLDKPLNSDLKALPSVLQDASTFFAGFVGANDADITLPRALDKAVWLCRTSSLQLLAGDHRCLPAFQLVRLQTIDQHITLLATS